jgi:prophage antirepressor-like protein
MMFKEFEKSFRQFPRTLSGEQKEVTPRPVAESKVTDNVPDNVENNSQENNSQKDSEVSVFAFENNNVRIVDKEGDVWFVAKDVCDILGYENVSQAITKNCRDDISNRYTIDLPDSMGRKQSTTIISELNLNRLIMRSRKPEAEKFQDWVCGEVIPAIRKHGGYLTPQKIEEVLLNPDTIIRLATELKKEREKRQLAEKQIEHDKPKVEYFDILVERKNNLCFRDTAKELGVPEKKFIQYLLDKNYLYRDKRNTLKPYAESIESGLFVLKEWASKDSEIAGVQTLVTVHGRDILRKKLCNNV